MAAVTPERAEQLKREFREAMALSEWRNLAIEAEVIAPSVSCTMEDCLDGWSSLPVSVVEKIEKQRSGTGRTVDESC